MAYDATLLAAIDTAITQIVSGLVSSYSINGQTYTMQDLDRLRALRKDVVREVSRAQRGRFAHVRRTAVGS